MSCQPCESVLVMESESMSPTPQPVRLGSKSLQAELKRKRIPEPKSHIFRVLGLDPKFYIPRP